jgi:hypothetical protein
MNIETFLHSRVSPYLWDIFGYTGGLVAIFYYNKIGLITFSCSIVLYGLLNILFDIFTVSFDYSNNTMPNYNNLTGVYNLSITNKKYMLQNKTVLSKEEIKTYMIDNSKLKIELSIYVGNNYYIKYMLFWIYFFGITKKNYTMNNYDDFKDTIFHFV